MAAKLLHSLADENPDLQKQIGCMTGIFQLFDRPNVLTGRRLNHKRLPLPSGDSHSGNGHYQGESFNANYRQDVGSNKGLNEKQRFSTESSRVSYSSSCSSPSSSFDCSKIFQPEVSSFDRNISHETPLLDPTVNQIKASPHFGRQFVDLRDVVKDSMNRELKGVPLHVKSKDEAVTRGVKNSNSLSTLNSSVDESYEVVPDGKPNVPFGLKESLRALAKFKEAPWYYNEAREITRLSYETKDPPRFSYDGLEANRLSFDSRDTTSKFVPKVKELPRLSLDSRERSIRGSNVQDGKLSNAQYSETWKRPPSVVAKLMGLEALPESTYDNHMNPTKADSRSLKMNELNRQIRIPKSPRNSMRDPTSPRWKNSDVVMKPTSSSRIPIEPAPWKQLEKRQISQSKLVKPVLVPQTTLPNSFPSVYSEIEKRLKDLEFKQSGKDLRALKQILEAMQSKGLLENPKEEEASKCTSPSQSHEVSSITKEGDSFGKYESPIVIMKPAKLVKKSGISSSSSAISVDRFASLHRLPNVSSTDGKKNPATNRTAKNKSLRNFNSEKKPSSLNVKPTQSLARAQQLPKENYSSSSKSKGSVSPRLQQKKVELEKRSRPPTASSDANKPVRQSNSNRQLIESTSPGRKLGYKSLNSQLGDDELSQISNWSRYSSHQEDDVPLSHLFVNVISEPERDLVVRSSKNSTEIGSQSPSIMAGKHLILTSRLEHDGLLAELPAVGLEHPSPVSVLDTSLYKDDELSPVKQTSNSPKGNPIQNSEERSSKVHSSPVEDCVPSTTETSRKKLQNVENLMRKLKRLNSNHDEARTDYIASLCENSNPNPDHRYISEILLASGLLLRDLGSGLSTFQLHPSGHPINPELFFVLEQTQSSCLLNVSQTKLGTEKFHRKLIFDAVNEILVKKSTLIGILPEPWLTSEKLAKKTLSAKKLLKELCMEIEELQSNKSHCCIEEDELKNILQEDAMYRSEDWLDFNGDISVAVLDVERLIFKDLVDEIVRGERDSMPTKPSSRRKLFVK